MKNNYRSWIAGGMLLFSAVSLNAQTRPLAQLVEATREMYATRVYQAAPFSVSNAVAAKGEANKLVKDATLLNLSVAETRKMWQAKPQYAIMRLPMDNQPAMELELVQQSPLAEGFKVTTSTSNDQAVPYVPGAYYRGIIKGHPNSTVAISVFENEIIGIASTETGENLVLGRLDKAGNESEYILYSDKNLPEMKTPGCAAVEPEGYKEKLKEYLQETANKTTDASHCVKVYLECDYALRTNKGSVAATTNFITAVFNNVATLYANELVTTAVSQVFVWDTPDSYNTTNSNTALTQFKTTRPTFNGTLAHLAALGGSNIGGIAWIDVICNQSYHYAYSNIYSSYSTVPTYSWTVEVMTHEMGHNLGSPHTQSCSWVGGALDNCYTTEGGCAAGPAPVNGGTIMSYCHLTSYGINFNNGFGTQPGNLIRSRVNSATCLTACGGGTPVTYCVSKGTSTSYEYINQVQLNTINKTSGNNSGYADFTATDITTLTPGSFYTTTLTPGFVSGAYTENWAVWIDYNKDGDFADAGEAVGSGSGTGAVSISFTVPTGVSGTTRMRVSMKYGGAPTSCETFSYGEVEDYSIQLGSGASPAALGATTSTPVTLYPNPAKDEVHIRWTSATQGQATIVLTDLAGRQLVNAQYNSQAGANDYLLPLRDMPAGNYLVNVQTDGQQYHYKLTVTH